MAVDNTHNPHTHDHTATTATTSNTATAHYSHLKPKAYSYLRFSTPDQMKGDSFRRQTELSRMYAEENGLDLDDTLTFQDLGVSAFRGKNAEEGELGAFIEAVDQGKVKRGSFLLVESLDRLSRQSPYKAFLQFSNILNRGLSIVTLQDGKVYSAGSNGNDLAFSDLMVSIAVMQRAYEESLTKSRRLSEVWKAKRRKAADGSLKLTSRCPEWLKLDKKNNTFHVIEERAAIVQRIFEMTLDGIGKRVIAATFNAEGIKPFGRGKGWHYSYVTKILENEATIGRYQPHKMQEVQGKRKRVPVGEPIENYFPAVISEETFLKAKRMRKERKIAGANVGNRYSNLFSGLAVCGVCGGVMHFENKGKPPKGGTYLVCSNARMKLGCKRYSWRYPQAQAHILMNLTELNYRELFPTLYEKSRESVERLQDKLLVMEERLKATEAKLERLTNILIERPHSSTLLTRLDALEEEKQGLIVGIEKAARDLSEEQERVEGAGKEYEELEDALQRYIEIEEAGEPDAILEARRRLFQLLKQVIESITFMPASSNDKDEKPELDYQGNPIHGTIEIRFRGVTDYSRRIKVAGNQEDSRGFKIIFNEKGEVSEEEEQTIIVDAQWPPRDRIVTASFVADLL
ncbi:Recombinase [Oleidesulfovibrio alaskensis G20]|uniref:Recombinase n=1 Tax=Oleidesulfovibrio alaskensis (strain ATCC BAA-1058 / DSM 17464 / G20) TaxID=207559 RepID=Q30XM6_OLEA2|nr:recombinase family protein [Oleidesulfovibrio alaskensis]ABB39570.2 Recombinase [Oleidesulfovibrio alaskensis G20]